MTPTNGWFQFRHSLVALSLVFVMACRCMSVPDSVVRLQAEEVLPKHITPETLKAVRDGLEYLARTQSEDGVWREDRGWTERIPLPSVRWRAQRFWHTEIVQRVASMPSNCNAEQNFSSSARPKQDFSRRQTRILANRCTVTDSH